MKNRNILIISGANGCSNLGDDAMFESLVEQLRSYKKIKFKITTDGKLGWKSKKVDNVLPFISKTLESKRISMPIAVIRYKYLKIHLLYLEKLHLPIIDPWINIYYKTINKTDVIVISGAGAINDIFADHGIYGWGMIINLAKFFDKKVIITGNGIGPLKSKQSIKVLKEFINCVDRIYVRDAVLSKIELIRLGYSSDKIFEYIDDAFFLNFDNNDLSVANKILKNIGIKNEFIVINIHKWDKSFLITLFEHLEKVLINNTKYDVLLLPNYFEGSMNDIDILYDFKKELISKGFKNIFFSKKRISANESKAILSKAKYSIATRYHIGVFSLSVGTPSILISLDDSYYVQKMKGILKWYGLEKFTVQKKNLHLLNELIKDVETNYKKYTTRIVARNSYFKKSGFLSVKHLIQII